MAIEEIDVRAKHAGGRPLLYKTPEELEERIKEYFDWCDQRVVTVVDKNGEAHDVKKPRPYTLSGLAYFLDVDRQTLLNYSERDEFFGTIARARKRCGVYAEEQLFEGNDRGAKFALMNNYGWIESQQIDLTATAVHELAPADLDALKTELVRLALEAQAKGLLGDGGK